jgi:hypothetical protein
MHNGMSCLSVRASVHLILKTIRFRLNECLVLTTREYAHNYHSDYCDDMNIYVLLMIEGVNFRCGLVVVQ